MARESRKWMVLVATIWIQAFTGTNLDFSSYSSDMKSALGISQVQLNYLSVASDFGKAFGWCSGVSLLYFPTWFVLFFAAFVGLFGYGLQWLVIHQIISLPYLLVLLLSLLSGCSICWFNTVCYVLCIKNFETNRALALSLSVSFNGLSAAIYNLVANSINPNDKKLYLLLNAVIPLITSIVSLPPITTRHLSNEPSPSDNHIPTKFYYLTVLAVITGLYLLVLNPISINVSIARFVLSGAVFLLIVLPHLVRFDLEDSSVDKETETRSPNDFSDSESNDLFKDRVVVVLGEEHSTRVLIRSRDFWLYYVAYLCGGTLGLVYSNNLGQISESLGFHSDVGSLVSLYSACSFFGRLLSTTPEFFRHKIYYARTGWLALALIPTPIAFLLLVFSDSKATLVTATTMIGLSSGFVFSAAVSITSELFGSNRAGVNHNILITNIPIGSLLYSLLAALIYEANIGNSDKIAATRDGSTVCVGRDCYRDTFVWWWLISLLGLVSCSLLFLRTKATYKRIEKHRKHSTQTTLLKSFSSDDDG